MVENMDKIGLFAAHLSRIFKFAIAKERKNLR